MCCYPLVVALFARYGPVWSAEDYSVVRSSMISVAFGLTGEMVGDVRISGCWGFCCIRCAVAGRCYGGGICWSGVGGGVYMRLRALGGLLGSCAWCGGDGGTLGA